MNKVVDTQPPRCYNIVIQLGKGGNKQKAGMVTDAERGGPEYKTGRVGDGLA